MEEVKSLRRKRAAVKRRITNVFNRIETEKSPSMIESSRTTIECDLKLIDEFNELINTEFHEMDQNEDDLSTDFMDELDGQSNYILDIRAQLGSLPKEPKPESVKGTNCELKLPYLNCPTFSGEGSTSLEFSSFLAQFQDVIGLRSNLAPSTKFTYLRTYLKGYALKVIRHLNVTDSNYEVAIDLLKTEFLNVPSIVDSLFKKLLEIKPKFDPSYQETKIFINDFRCILSDLKEYERDLLKDKWCKEFVSHILVQKLPIPFRKELIRKLDCDFPSIDEVMDNYVSVIRTLNMSQNRGSDQKSFQSSSKSYDSDPNLKTPYIGSTLKPKNVSLDSEVASASNDDSSLSYSF